METITATGTDLQIATDINFNTIVNNDDGSLRKSQAFTNGDLPFGVNLYTRVRYVTDTIGESSWSPIITFHIEVPADIIGVCLDPKNGAFFYIDINGNEVTGYSWQQSRIFRTLTMATMDSERAPATFLKVPKVYIRTATGGVLGTISEGKKCWWLSDIKLEGFRTHPAFKRVTGGAESEYCYIGTYAGGLDTASGKTCLASKAGTLAKSDTYENLFKFINNRNNQGDGEVGYRGYDIYDHSLVCLLGLIMYGTANFQAAAGQGTTVSSPQTGTSDAKMIFKGTQEDPTVWLADCWRTYQTYLYKVKSKNGRLSFELPYSSDEAVPAGTALRYTMPTSSGWVNDVLDCPITIGEDVHDLMELFLPKTVVSSENLSAFKDYYAYQSGEAYLKTGGSWKETTNWCGPFFISLKPYTEEGGYIEGMHLEQICEYAYGQDKLLEITTSAPNEEQKDAITGEFLKPSTSYKWYAVANEQNTGTDTKITNSSTKELCPYARAEFNSYSTYPAYHVWSKTASTFKETPCGVVPLNNSISTGKLYCTRFGAYNKQFAESTDFMLGGDRGVLAGGVYARNRLTILANNMTARLCKN